LSVDLGNSFTGFIRMGNPRTAPGIKRMTLSAGL
jgi:hypothetical protein